MPHIDAIVVGFCTSQFIVNVPLYNPYLDIFVNTICNSINQMFNVNLFSTSNRRLTKSQIIAFCFSEPKSVSSSCISQIFDHTGVE